MRMQTSFLKLLIVPLLFCSLGVYGMTTADKHLEAADQEIADRQEMASQKTARDMQAIQAPAEQDQVKGLPADAAGSIYRMVVEFLSIFSEKNNAKDPAKFTKNGNDALRSAMSASCDPRIMPPLAKSEVSLGAGEFSCTTEQLQQVVRLVSGRKPLPETDSADGRTLLSFASKTAAGQQLQHEINQYYARISDIEQALLGTLVPEIDELLRAYALIAETPDVAAINAMSGSGSIERDELFQKQLKIQLMVQVFRSQKEATRNLAIRAAQVQETHYQSILAKIKRLGQS